MPISVVLSSAPNPGMVVLGGAEGARDRLILGRCGFAKVLQQHIWVVSSFENGKHEDVTFDIVPNLPGEGLY